MPVDTSDMLAVHAVLRDACRDGVGLVGSVGPADDDRLALVSSYLANVLALLDAHHRAEDLVLVPLLLARVPDRGPVSRVAAQHASLDPVAEAVERRLADWAGSPSAPRARSLAAALTALGRALGRHLDDEEAAVLPLAAEHLSPQEWARLAAQATAAFTGDRPWLVLGLIRARLSGEQAQAQLAAMPTPAREFWLSVGRPQYEAFVATLLG